MTAKHKIEVRIDPVGKTVWVAEEFKDLRNLYSHIKERYLSDDLLIGYTFPFKFVGDCLFVNEGWTLWVKDKQYQGAKIMEFQQ